MTNKSQQHCQFHFAYNVSSYADEDNGNSSKWKRNVCQNEQEEWSQLWYVGCQCIANRLLQIVKEETTCTAETYE